MTGLSFGKPGELGRLSQWLSEPEVSTDIPRFAQILFSHSLCEISICREMVLTSKAFFLFVEISVSLFQMFLYR